MRRDHLWILLNDLRNRVAALELRPVTAPTQVLQASNSPTLTLATYPPPQIGTASPGFDNVAAHGQHTHAHGEQAGGSLHALANEGQAGFLSPLLFTKLLNLPGACTLTAPFVQPPALTAAAISVSSSSGFGAGEIAFIIGGGYYQVSAVLGPTSIAVTNLDAAGNLAPGLTVPAAGSVSAAGPQGIVGTPGAPGTPGTNAFSSTTIAFNQPAVGATVIAQVASSSWAALGQVVFVQAGGYFEVTVIGPTSLTLKNLGANGNAGVGSSIPAGAQVTPAGPFGPSAGTLRLWVVAANAPVGGDGSFSKPFKTVQLGLNAAAAGDVVLVLPGLYSEAVTWPNTDGVALIGLDAGSTVISAPAGDTLTWIPPSGGFDRMTICELTLANLHNGGRCLVLDGLNTLSAGFAQFIRVHGRFDRLILDKGTFTGDAAYLRLVSVAEFTRCEGTWVGARNLSGWNGSTTLLNCGWIGWRSCTIGNQTTGLTYIYDDSTTTPFGGRQGCYLLSTSVYGSVTVGKTPLFVLDPSSAIYGDVTDSGLVTFAGPNHAPIVYLAGTVGAVGLACSVTLNLPPSTATGVPLVDFSNGTFYPSTAKPLKVASTGLGVSRNYAKAQSARIISNQASSVVAGADTDLDLRAAVYSQAALSAIGSGAIDRDIHVVAANIPAGTALMVGIVPPFPPTSPIWYPGGAPYTVTYELAGNNPAWTTLKVNTAFTVNSTGISTQTAMIHRNRS